MRNSVRLLSAVALASCLAAGPAIGQIEAGDKSVNFQGLIQSKTGTDKKETTVFALVGLNTFRTRNFAWRLQIGGLWGESEGENTGLPILGAGVEWDFNHPGAKTIPFLALDALELVAPGSGTATIISPNAGFRSFVSRSTSFDVNASFNTLIVGGEDGGSISFIMLRLGFSYFLGKDARR